MDLVPERLRRALAEGWPLHAASMEYVPEGGGSHHWKLTGSDGRPHFVTVDDLDNKDWLGDTRGAVFKGLGRALGTAAALRHEVGLRFVAAPIAARDGGLLRRLDDLASAIRLFRNRHGDTPDTRRWWRGLVPELDQLPGWLDLLAQRKGQVQQLRGPRWLTPPWARARRTPGA